jgi:hypothetical protein
MPDLAPKSDSCRGASFLSFHTSHNPFPIHTLLGVLGGRGGHSVPPFLRRREIIINTNNNIPIYTLTR